jgi:hypothetical protein
MQLLVSGKPVTVSADRVQPAYILNEADCRHTTSTDIQPARFLRPHHRRHRQLHRLHAPAAMSVSPHASARKQTSPWGGGDVGIPTKQFLSPNPSQFTTDGPSISMSWFRIVVNCLKVVVLSCSCALSDERSGLSFVSHSTKSWSICT